MFISHPNINLLFRSRHDSASNKVVFMVVSDDFAWVKVIITLRESMSKAECIFRNIWDSLMT